tara:strand:- start:464 stop:1147 length:684 start_codon:yes stop_codon:yes gene_type:complete
MATQDGPAPTFSNGLVFLCDPGNPESYNPTPTSVGVQYSDRLVGGPVTGSFKGDCSWNSTDKCWNCDGAGDWVEIQPFTTPGQALTVSAWAKSDTANWNDHGFIASKRNSFIMHPSKNSTKVVFFVYTDVGTGTAQFTGATINQWNNYVGTYDGSQSSFYINGELKQTVSLTGTVAPDDSGIMLIGGDDSQNRSIDGKMGPVRIYDTALTAEQILEDYEAGRKRYPL